MIIPDEALTYWLKQFDRFLEVEKSASSHTREAYRTDLQQLDEYLRQRFKGREPQPSLLTRASLRGYLGQLVREGYTARSVARKLATLRSFARYLVRESALPANPTLNLTSPKLPKRLPHFLTQTEMQRLLSLPEGDSRTGRRDRLILQLFYSTGMRVSEVAGLRIGDVRLWEGTLRVLGKRDKVRLLPIGRQQSRLLKEYLGERGGATQDPVFVREDGRAFSRQDLARLLQSYMRRVVDAQKSHPHALRHSFATHLIDEGADIMSVKELLGHASLSTTQIYTHVSAEHLRRVYKKAHPRAEKK